MIQQSELNGTHIRFYQTLVAICANNDGNWQEIEAEETIRLQTLIEMAKAQNDKQADSKLTSDVLPPEIQCCIIPELGNTDPNAVESSEDDSASSDVEEARNIGRRQRRSRILGLLSIEGYGIETSGDGGNARNRKRPKADKTNNAINSVRLMTDPFPEHFPEDFFPNSYEASRVYMARDIYYNHSEKEKARAIAKKGPGRRDRNLIATTIVQDPPRPPPFIFR